MTTLRQGGSQAAAQGAAHAAPAHQVLRQHLRRVPHGAGHRGDVLPQRQAGDPGVPKVSTTWGGSLRGFTSATSSGGPRCS
eukprot:1189951-Prorocentrum_minimum.AAC.1